MINLEKILTDIDLQLKKRSKKDLYLIYIMIFSVIFTSSYLLFWESSKNEFKTKRLQVLALKEKIKLDKTYLNKNDKTKVTEIDTIIKESKNKTQLYIKNNNYLKKKIQEISSLIYNETAWGEYLLSISKKAKENNIKILNFENKYSKNNSSFGHVLDITIRSSGKFNNMLNFINSLEQSELVVDIHTLKIEAKEQLVCELKISVWGISER
jgi:hypothetical protein